MPGIGPQASDVVLQTDVRDLKPGPWLAPAKINLMLHVTGRLEDGYHALQSLVGFASFGDLLYLSQNPRRQKGFLLEIQGPFAKNLDSSSENLIIKAAHWLKEFLSIDQGAHIRLQKNLPLSAGIGGGSSDAATTIAALLKLWAVESPPFSTLIQKSGILGADVPVCLAHQLNDGSLFWVEGTGKDFPPQRIKKVTENLSVLLINSGMPVETPTIFKGLKDSNQPFSKKISPFGESSSSEDLLAFCQDTRNDLTEAAIAQLPQIKELLETIKAQEGCIFSRLSGSGGTCYGVFISEEACQKAEEALAPSYAWVQRGTIRGHQG